jgi:polar amino acid transport system substrate-binding protein
MASLVLGFAALVGPTRLAAADLDEVLAAKRIRVGLPATEAPPLLQTEPNGIPGGLEGAFIAEVARRMDVKITFVRTAGTSEELIAQVVSSQVDIGIGQLTDSLEWAKSVRFSRPYVQLQELRLVDRLAASRSGGATQLLDDHTAQVTSVAGSVVLPAIREGFGERLTVLPNLQAAIDAVLTGRAVAAIADDVAVSRWLEANPAAGLRLQLIPRRDRFPGLAMAVNWKSENLQAWLNLCIEKCMLDGTLQLLSTKYLGDRPRATK